ncbi:hypothetical protein N7492_003919 [Penicillium capsulatum]|uniref:Thioesterase n=1 Tax=Penicillium capsulatum TaxID=69766 RepID=A0A9W9IMS3_9EURO|nr:hypothetical protein N7492_003919 [Penicillium capsulatum]
MRDLLSILTSLASWRTLALVLAFINLKNLPFVWHFRLLYHFAGNLRLKPNAPFFPKEKAIVDPQGKPTHPVFVPYGITSRTPLLETDYNLHKSNSTYFTDLDVSRTALVTRLYSPGVGIVSKELDLEFADKAQKEGKAPPKRRLPIMIVLGSVYCSFKREIKPFKLYEMHSKVISWDQKWMYILTVFLRPAKRAGEEKTLLATALSKYVVKKGRLTVSPERLLRASGFLPASDENSTQSAPVDSSTDASGVGTPASGEGITAGEVDGSLVREVLKISDGQIPRSDALEDEKRINAASWNTEEWSWERIEQERLRGLQVVKPYIDVDQEVGKECEKWTQ